MIFLSCFLNTVKVKSTPTVSANFSYALTVKAGSGYKNES